MPKKNRAIVSVTNDLYTDNRVDKVCLFLVLQGYEVLLVGRKLKNSKPLQERGYQTKRLHLIFEKGPFFYMEYNVRLFLLLLVKKCTFLVSNDLDTLLANYVTSKFKPSVRLVYDSHELFTEVPELTQRPFTRKVWESIEQWIFPRLKTVYTVNSSIANIYEKKYRKKIHVVRNISPQWNPSDIPTKKALGIPENEFLIIVQGAGINVHRGVEEAVEAMQFINHATLLIVGDGDVIPILKEMVKTLNLTEKVLFFAKRPYHEMMAFTYHADIGLSLDKPTNLNYTFSLPNKVFDYIHAGTPFIATDLTEIKNIVEKYEVGIIIEELKPELLAQKIKHLQENPAFLLKMKGQCKIASETENWENETRVLATIYPKTET
jgi:glycosyltransferase involved in cell wall biosynthesis